MREKKTKKVRVERTRNNGTFTESMFWGGIRAALRQKSRWWKPISQCKINARRPYKGILKRQRWEYLCNICKRYFPEKRIEVHHTFGVGQLKCANDLPQFVENLFCEVDKLECLCSDCHSKISKTEKK
jgi:hypothetical protein